MRVKLKQETRDLFAASFSILCDNERIGGVDVQGKLGSPESIVSVTLLTENVVLRREHKVDKKGNDAYRPYEILSNERKRGEVYQATKKKGLFKSYGYQYACLDNIEYSMFPIGFGDEGAKNPIYRDEEQIALVKKKAVITDDMHDFEIIVKNRSYLMISIIISSYIYAKAFFKPGDLMKKGTIKSSTITTEKNLLSKYDASFEKQY